MCGRSWFGRVRSYTHRSCKFCLNLASGLSSHVLTVLVWTGAVVHTPSLQVLFELGFRTEQLCAVGPGLDGCCFTYRTSKFCLNLASELSSYVLTDGPGLDRCCFTHTVPASSV